MSVKTLLSMLRLLVFNHFNTLYTYLYRKCYTPIVYQQGASIYRGVKYENELLQAFVVSNKRS